MHQSIGGYSQAASRVLECHGCLNGRNLGGGSHTAERDRLRRLATPPREAMLETLAHLAAVHGSAESYLLAGGLSEAQIGCLRGRLLE